MGRTNPFFKSQEQVDLISRGIQPMRLAHGTKYIPIHAVNKPGPFLVLLEDFHCLCVLLLECSRFITVSRLVIFLIICLTKNNIFGRCVCSLYSKVMNILAFYTLESPTHSVIAFARMALLPAYRRSLSKQMCQSTRLGVPFAESRSSRFEGFLRIISSQSSRTASCGREGDL